MFVLGKSRTICSPSDTPIYGISRDGSKNFNIRTCEHLIHGQLRMGARKAKNASLHVAEEFHRYILSSEFSSTSSTYKDHFLCLAKSQISWGRKVLSPCILNIIAIFPSQSESSMKSCAALMHNIMYQVGQLLSIKLAMCNLKWSNMQ